MATYREIRQQVETLSASEQIQLLDELTAIVYHRDSSIASLQDVSQSENWQFLVSRSHPWRKQLYLKGRKLLAATIWSDMIANGMTPEQAAENWGLPAAAIHEAVQYCQTHQDLLRLEAEEERFRLLEKGVALEPIAAAG